MLRALHKPTADLKAMSSTHTERYKRPEREKRPERKREETEGETERRCLCIKIE